VLLVLLAGAAAARATETAPAVTVGSASSPAAGSQALDDAVFPGLKERISLDLRGMDMIEVLKFLSSKGGFNIVTSADVQGRATLTLTDVTVRDALDIVLVTNGLAVERRGTILYIMSGQQYEQLYGHRYGDPRQSVVVQLKYANPGQVSALLGNMKSAVGRIIVDEPTATLALLDTPGILVQMQQLIATVDLPTVQRQVPTETRVVPLQFAKAEDVKAEVEAGLTPDIGKVRLDKRQNTLIITDVAPKLPQLEDLIKAFDAKGRQVYIESSILSVTLRDEFDTGIEWSLVSESEDVPDISITQSLPIASDATNAIKVVVGTIAANDVTATVKALQTFGDTKVLSSPHISVMNNEEARIHVGRREVYVTTTTTQTTSTVAIPETVNFVDVGVRLNVTPVINQDGFVMLRVRPEVSSVAELRKTASGNQIPIIETSEAETRVMVKDGATILIGGLMKDELTLTKQKIPFLGDLPLLGPLFSNRSDRIKRTELVILLTPHVMSGEELYTPAAATAQVGWPASARSP
jgi:MSHA type pilus biogenesis protein MshL